MQNIWGFILQSLSLSLVGGLILLVKRIFKDKLPPSWQYGVWSIFALRAVIPVRAERFVVLPVSFYLEWFKASIEGRLNSAYTEQYSATELHHIFPVITKTPESITDKIFVFYFFGVAAFLLYYLFSYIRLRFTVSRGIKVSGEEADRINALFGENKVRFVKIITLEGIDSAFICGILRPVLVIPSGRRTDEKVIMHEIIHLKHFDPLQSIFWCILRSLHWCNPFMHLLLNIIGNDMESRCDQRVLEMLDGEERREYGILLLNEVNRKYARMLGTTSVSNGGKNIAKRIESIVRFKKYPKGMALVSICIIIVLAIPSFLVSANSTYNDRIFYPTTDAEMQKSLIYTRLYRCESLAGAIDTYAKALINNNGIMLLTASPTDRAEEITAGIKNCCYFDSGFTSVKDREYGVAVFSLFNLIKTGDNRYTALLAFSIPKEIPEGTERFTRENAGTLFVPIEVFKEKNYWVVNETGERTVSDKFLDKAVTVQTAYYEGELPSLYTDTQKGENGTFNASLYTTFSFNYDSGTEDGFFIQNAPANDSFSFIYDSYTFDNTVHRNAEFDKCIVENKAVYTYEGEDRETVNEIGHDILTAEKGKSFPDEKQENYPKSSYHGNVNTEKTPWDGVSNAGYTDMNLDPDKVKDGYAERIKYIFFIDGEASDEFIAEVNVNG